MAQEAGGVIEHLGHDSVVEFGKRYAQTMIEALGW
jgi:hypothetical protein